MTFIKKIKQFREQYHLPQRKVAEVLGIDETTYCKIERGERKVKREQVFAIAKLLKVDKDKLLRLWLANQITTVVTNDKKLSNKVLSMAKNRVTKTMDEVNNDIELLKTPKQLSSKKYGVKASSLNNNPLLFEWIPNGFILSNELVAKIAKNALDENGLTIIKGLFIKLLETSEILILRSSSSLEWVQGHSFAGLFNSFRGATNFDEFIDFLKTIYEDSNSEKISNYADLKNVSLPKDHIALLVQNEIKCNKSALVVLDKDSDYVEIFNSDIKNAVSGSITPNFSQFRSKKDITNKEGVMQGLHLHPNAYNELYAIIDNARQSVLNGNSIHLEIGFTSTQTFVLQINNLSDQNVNDFINDRRSDIFISKSEAMQWFHKVGLFKEKLKIYPFLTKEKLYEHILMDFDFEKPVTLRFSYKNQVNLPRNFFNTKDELKQWLENTTIPNSKKYEIIVHEYLNVRRSFELLLNENDLLLEQIPGMWESDNILNPDVIYLDNKTAKAWIWNKERTKLKFADNPKEHNDYQKVTADNTLVEWQTKLNDVVSILKKHFKFVLPLNFHFVEDDTKDWSFLNIRKGFSIVQQPKAVQMERYVIGSILDIEKWDGIKPLHLQISNQRNYEKELLDIIEKLPKNIDDYITVDFGLLSHPAIILREFGYKLIPSYFFNDINNLPSNYSVKTLDVNDDPIKRIMSEQSVYEDEDFKVVHDRNPIVENHLLVISKHPYTSMIDNKDLCSKYKLLFKNLMDKKLIDNFILVERGRAQFCTSGFTNSHAHAHFLPLDSFKENIIGLFVEKTKCQKTNTLEKATNILKRSKNEYILLMKEEEIYISILPKGQSYEKQLIRNFFGEAKYE
ncbi:MAG: helix-turn-helix domain-containing protein [Dysgonamonadaceae bacterium]|jgi:transcriptional regulator with XRE-family HTH domain/diadenosine tetraphosphate (Ap4A) HIT family hydrolase|nr:helix-turn-helix domain-containing protein [Dysgonamonadaceae bacterium]